MISVAFFGSHPLGEACLTRLYNHPDVSVEVVVTYPEGADTWWEGSVRELALTHEAPVLTLAEERCVTDLDVDYLLSVYYPNILDEELLSHPKRGALNLHQAELPRYRGSNVFSHSIMNARQDDHWRHGTTLHVMAESVDAGDVVDRKFVDIHEDDTARSLYERVRRASVELFEESLPDMVDGTIFERATPQSEFDGPRYFHAKDSLDDLKAVPADALGEPDRELELYDRIRALDFPSHEPAYVELGGERVYLTLTADERGD